MEKSLSYFGITDIGPVRENNEDAFCVKEIWNGTHILLLVVDGCGGYEGGEVASDIAVKTILNVLESEHGDSRMDLLRMAIVNANNIIHRERETHENLSSMGCVLTAVIIDIENNLALLAHVGDTRCYLMDESGIRKLTHDHSMVGELEDDGYLSELEAMHHPLRSVIDRMVGDETHYPDDGFVDTTIIPLPAKYGLLLCSDGLTDVVTSNEIKTILQSEYTTEEKCRSLVEVANKKSGKDNITVIIAETI